ncbi:hypothetical protein [Hymenobacter sp.]|uniref:hypothetical protein n=1 Tax=Hymenobacter sp. TaxID=1898978 RepID=UPI00286AE294|nr:hypothetical protein [Hymenobacter sp.]
MSSPRLLLALLLGVGALLSSRAAVAQIVHENPAQVKAANRRALREAQRTDSPYKDSHLAVTPARLRRGESTQPRPERSDELDYETVTGPPAKPAGLLNLRRRKKPQAPPVGTGKKME